MSSLDIINALNLSHAGVIRTADALNAGLSRTTLMNLERSGVLDRVARGQYILADVFIDELFIMQQRYPGMTYSHETALFLHDMSERTPPCYSVTLPSNARLSATFPADVKKYYIKPTLFMLGQTTLPSKMGHYITAYDTERTICDILRSRNRVDSQTVSTALKQYTIRKHNDYKKLSEYAETFGVTKLLRQYLEVLL
ncbi:transcriptional regulator [Clostridia bacterium]|nr:transcriptional regulator [Clostridia bacterium]